MGARARPTPSTGGEGASGRCGPAAPTGSDTGALHPLARWLKGESREEFTKRCGKQSRFAR